MTTVYSCHNISVNRSLFCGRSKTINEILNNECNFLFFNKNKTRQDKTRHTVKIERVFVTWKVIH